MGYILSIVLFYLFIGTMLKIITLAQDKFKIYLFRLNCKG